MISTAHVPVREPSVPLDARGLTKRFGSFTAVDSLDVTLEPGTITGFSDRTAPENPRRCACWSD
jgi:hypothetical protein